MPTLCFHWRSWNLSSSFSLYACILNKVEEKGKYEVHIVDCLPVAVMLFLSSVL